MTGLPLRLTEARLRAGVWQAILSGGGAAAPAVTALFEGNPVLGVSVAAAPGGGWAVQVPVPPEAVSDGVNVLVIRADEGVETQVVLVGGAAVEGDLRAEVDFLRAEVDMLKRAIRRQFGTPQGG